MRCRPATTVAAENYLQHAEHYNRIIMAAQAQNVGMPGMEGQSGFNGSGRFNQPESFQRDDDATRMKVSKTTSFLRSGLFPSARPTINISSRSPIFRRTLSRRSSRSRYRNRSLLLHRMARNPSAENLSGRPRDNKQRAIECRRGGAVGVQ